jgi:hypothetical protein
MLSQGAAPQQPAANPAATYTLKGTETTGPAIDSVPKSDRKTENGVRMIRYNGQWRTVVGKDDKNRLILE